MLNTLKNLFGKDELVKVKVVKRTETRGGLRSKNVEIEKERLPSVSMASESDSGVERLWLGRPIKFLPVPMIPCMRVSPYSSRR